MIDLSILSLILVAVLGLALVVIWKRQGELRHSIAEKGHQLERQHEDLQALYKGAAGLGSHLARLENQINRLSDRQEQLDVRDLSTHNYNLAIDLVHQGADADELVRKCGLLHEEAELLVRLHGHRSAV